MADAPGIVTPQVATGNEHVWHLYVVQVDARDRVLRDLAAAGISTGIHYPAPIHQLPAFSGLGYRTGDFPMAEEQSKRLLTIPLFPGITLAQQERVVDTLVRATQDTNTRGRVAV